ncbi:MAG: DinB family protein [Vicinamibacteria bacterium]|jgi:uncharacterized damage-inducible protein DinB|nr:DinB family protein [Vicinamibacteria bacterium]
MTNKDALGRLLEYTVWANRRVLRGAIQLPPGDFTKPLGGSFGTVRGTFTHMMGAEWIWLERFQGRSPTQWIDEAEFADLIALRERWGKIEDARARWFKELPDDAVSQRIAYKTLDGNPGEARLWQLIQHVANHATYHRGQAVFMLKLLGASPAATDLVLWDREKLALKEREKAGLLG